MMKGEKVLSSLDYCIDKVIRRDDEVFVIGWAYKLGTKKVDIKVKDIQDVKFHKVDRRVDLFNKYEQAEGSADAGFQISFPYRKKVTLIFSAGGEEEKVNINVDAMSKRVGKNRLKRALGMCNMMSVKKGIKEVKKNGV